MTLNLTYLQQCEFALKDIIIRPARYNSQSICATLSNSLDLYATDSTDLIDKIAVFSYVKSLFAHWEHYSGFPQWPVPPSDQLESVDITRALCITSFHQALQNGTMYEGGYGAMRLQLVKFLLAELAPAIPNW